MGLSSGHSELFVAISQLKELRTATKAQIASQESAIYDLFKWSTKENNRAIQDVIERFEALWKLTLVLIVIFPFFLLKKDAVNFVLFGPRLKKCLSMS